MKNAFKALIITVALPALLFACGKGEQPTAVSVGPKANPAEVAKPVEEAPKQDVVTQQSEPPLKNPFQSYIIAKRLDNADDVIIKGPLECCELSTFTVVAALVVAGDKPYALVSGPDAKRYIVHLGDKVGVNGGKVVHIDTTGITVREIIKDAEGNVASTNDVELSISEKQEGGSRPGGAPGKGPSSGSQRPAQPAR
ncbi:MAG: pilus assembly protein PilP [Deltaproteobacteria bacterium]|nr:pilus assembly protein PilP [Deltaproteobacteria bacterium]